MGEEEGVRRNGVLWSGNVGDCGGIGEWVDRGRVGRCEGRVGGVS